MVAAIMAAICYWAVKSYEKHHQAEKYDDRRDNSAAIEKYKRDYQGVKNKK